MKRCIICGNIGDDNCTVCEICGNPFIDNEDGAAGGVDVLPDFPELDEVDGPEDLAFEDLAEPPEAEAFSAAGTSRGAGSSRAGTPRNTEMSRAGTPREAGRSGAGAPREAGMSGAGVQQEAGMSGAGAPQDAGISGAGVPRDAGMSGTGSLQDADMSGTGSLRTAETGRTAGRSSAGTQRQGTRPRRTYSGPQIYGQTETYQGEPQDQGMIRRTVQGRPAQPQASRETSQNQAARQPRTASPRPVNQRQAVPGGAASNPPQRTSAPRQAGPQQGGQMGRSAGSSNRFRQVMETARDRLGSGFFAVIALLATVHLGSSVAAVFMGELNYVLLVKLIQNFSLPSQISGYVSMAVKLLSKLDSGELIPNLVVLLPKLLFCIGLWLIFILARTAGERMSGIGFLFARLVVAVRMIVSCVIALGVIVICVAVVLAAWASRTRTVFIMSVVMLVAAAAVALMVIMYYCCYLATLKTCKLNAATGEGYGKVSRYVAFIHIILALTNIINLLSGIVNTEITGIVSAVSGLGWMILFSVWILLYRSAMKKMEG